MALMHQRNLKNSLVSPTAPESRMRAWCQNLKALPYAMA